MNPFMHHSDHPAFAPKAGLSLLLLLLLATCPGCKKAPQVADYPDSSTAGNYFQTTFQSESEFIVQAITTDVAEMCCFAKDRAVAGQKGAFVTVQEQPASPSSAVKYAVSVQLPKGPLHYELEIDGAGTTIWSPEVYTNFARAIMNSLGLKGRDEPHIENADASLLQALLNLTPQTIEKENHRISAALSGDFTNPNLHEEAAMLMGAFTLREDSGNFFEIRSPLCRMTAHLTMASVLGGEPERDVNGQAAEALLYTLMNNQKAALGKIAALGGDRPSLAAWSRALYARNTHDFRQLEKLESRSVLETIEYFRAYCESVDTRLAWEKLTDVEKISAPDYCRIVNARRASVELGHVMLEASVPLELREAEGAYASSKGGELRTQKELVAALNELPGRCVGADAAGAPRIQVIGWGQWAMFCQRHLCQALVVDYNFLARMWGVPDEAAKFSKKCDETFAGLRLYPFVRRFNCADEQSYHASVDDGFKVTRATPHLVPAQAWNYLCYNVNFAPPYRPNPNPHVNEWHSHNPPPGTAYNPYPRTDHPSLTRRPDTVALFEALHERAPFDPTIAYYLVRIKYQNNATYEQEEAVYRPVLEYDCDQMYELGKTLAGNPTAYEALMSKAAGLNPVLYYTLGDYFMGTDEGKGASYMEKGMALCPDSLITASHASVMIKYYLKKGEKDKAAKLADLAGEVYSESGLKAKAEFLETTGDYAGAFDYYQKIEERYNDSGDLAAFCLRYKQKTGDTKYDRVIQEKMAKIFPKGMEAVSLAELKGAPLDGVSVGGQNSETAKAGLNYGDVIVALNGKRVHSFEQYAQVRAAAIAPELDLIVWQRSQYREIKASPPEHLFGVDFPSYQGK
jgi:tetratricopeptide (TPR) repeat protein